MTIHAHVAVLIYNSLDQARISRLKAKRGPVFFAQFAFPPEAGADLSALAQSVAPGGNLTGLEIGGFAVAGSLKKPIPGIPGNWLTVRSVSQFAPQLFDMHNQPVTDPAAIRSLFYPGRKVRAAISAFPWVHNETGRKGVSFNLIGVMDAGPGEKLNIGNAAIENEFAQYAQAGGAATSSPFGAAAPSPAPASSAANPFATSAAAPSPAASNNPFAQ